ncbi:MAG: hypothetical protein M1831_000087 [Alyxoria varia]|nr:MAG: hypothetical protein M1831_000087 [Alyxoria varia]
MKRWDEEMPREEGMLPKDKYTIFDPKERKYRKGIHKLPKWTRRKPVSRSPLVVKLKLELSATSRDHGPIRKARSWPPAVDSLHVTDADSYESPADLTIDSLATWSSLNSQSAPLTLGRSKSWSELTAKAGNNSRTENLDVSKLGSGEHFDSTSTLSKSGSRSTLKTSDDSVLTPTRSQTIGHKQRRVSFRATMSRRWAAFEQKLRNPPRRERLESLRNAARRSKSHIKLSRKRRDRQLESLSEQGKLPTEKPKFITNSPHELSVSEEDDDYDSYVDAEEEPDQLETAANTVANAQPARTLRRSVLDLEGNVRDSEGTAMRIVKHHKSGKRWLLREPSIELYDIREEAGNTNR